MNDLSFLQGLTFVDTFFPNGAYAHSFGLEAAVQEGVIGDGRDLQGYLDQCLKEGVSRSDGIAVSVAHSSVKSNWIEAALDADRCLEAMKIGREVREAGRQMGRQVLRIGAEQLQHPMIKTMNCLVEGGKTSGHHAVAMGIVLGCCGWPVRAAVVTYLYQTVTGWISAAMRLLPIGQAEGQRLVHSLLPHVVQLGEQIEGLGLEHMTSWMPLHEIRMMRHARLEIRLFRS